MFARQRNLLYRIIKRFVPKRYRGKLDFWHAYFGLRFKCPVCRGWFRTFNPFGVKIRQNAQCPQCGCLERHRLLWLYLKNRTGFFKKKLKVLHVAPEQCLKKIFKKSRNLDYTTLDLYDCDVDLRMDVTDIKLPDNLFDCIICYHVLEHIPDDAKAISELRRVLKPGGFAIIQVPIDENAAQTYENSSIVGPKEREVAFGQYDHVRRYGRDYKNRLEKAGFSVKRDDYVRHLGEKRIAKYGLAGSEYIYVCSKSKV